MKEVIFGWRLNFIYDIITSVGESMGITFPPEMQNGKFGFYLDVGYRKISRKRFMCVILKELVHL